VPLYINAIVGKNLVSVCEEVNISMKGIIFVVWEKYLGERFGSKFIKDYREPLENQKAICQLPAKHIQMQCW
jgi:hypothetical protein